ncbi:hypothetical protein DFQ26_009276 [Actinomortierella ambigua]|nr:hypothetical protein DFQ26_009276 [Actinomortierella ambigua]
MSGTTAAYASTSAGPQPQNTSAVATVLDDPKFALEVKKCAFKKDDLKQQEIRTIVKITKLLRPFVPKRCPNKDRTGERAHTPHVVTRDPIVIIANAVLQATGYSKFAERLVPQVSGMSVHSLHLGTNTLYEALCSSEAHRLDAVDSSGIIFRSPAHAMSSDENSQPLYKAFFFNTEKVKSTCKAHGLFVPIGSQVDKKAEAASVAVKAKEAEPQPLRKVIGKLQESLKKLRRDGAGQAGEISAAVKARLDEAKRRALVP